MKADTPSAKKAADSVIAVLTTVGTEEQALTIAHHLVAEGLAACVNIVPGIRSVFRWEGKVNDDSEFLLIVKTVDGNFEPVRQAVKELHAYELPEILAFRVTRSDEAFARWVAESSRGEKAVAGADEVRARTAE